MNSDPSDMADRLDLSVSSIDMTNTSLAVHEEKDIDNISGIGMFLLREGTYHCILHCLDMLCFTW